MAIQGFFTGDVKIKDLNGVLKAVDGIVEVATDAGTVTSVGLTVGSTGTDVNVANSPITSSGNITLNLPTASATNRGLLSSADWTTFNNKQAAGNYVTLDTYQTITASKTFSVGFNLASVGGTNQPTFFENTNNLHSGSVGSNIFGFNTANNIYFGKGSDNGGVLSWNNSEVRYYTLPNANGTIALVGGSGVGTVTSIATTGPITGGTITSTGTIGITQATTSTDGYLSSTDWNTFNSKQAALTFSAPLINTSGTISIPAATSSVNGYLSSADWDTFNNKQAALSGTGFVKISGTTISYDNSTYYLASNPSSFITLIALSATAPLSYSNTTGVFSISQATTSTDGYLSSTDWNTFNNKQAAGNYITALTGEATASGPGSASVTLSTSAVTGKLLTGLNLTGGGTIADTDSILQAFGKVQNQISGLAGGVTYQGTWNASTNTPTLTSSVGTKGYYYIVSVAGSTNLNGITDWKIGDWAIFNGTTWDKVDNTDAVSSVNGFTGAVSLTTSNISEGTNLYYLDSRARLALSFTAGSGAYDNTTGVITIPTNTSQLTNGANFITLSSLSASSPLAYNNGTGAFSIQVATSSQNGYLSSTDWTTFNSKQPSGNYVTTDTTQTITALKTFTAKVTLNTGGTDDQLQLVGTAPSVRLTNAVTGATINGFIAMSGGANNYIQGSVSGDMTIGNQNNGKILFGFGSGTATQKMSLDSSGNAVLSGGLTLGSTLSNGTYTYTLPSATGTLALTSDIPVVTGYVPYTGASANVDLGTFDLTADVITGATGSFASSGGSDTFAINHSSGSGIALNITKGGNNEGLYINKTSGSGNAATIIGTLNATTLVKSGGTSSEFLKADGSVDSSTYLTTSAASSTYLPLTGGTLTGVLSINSALRIKSGAANGVLLETYNANQLVVRVTPSSTTYDSTLIFPSSSRNFTFPAASGTIALTSDIPSLSGYVQGSGTTNYLPKFTGASTIGNSSLQDDGSNVFLSNGYYISTRTDNTSVLRTHLLMQRGSGAGTYADIFTAGDTANGVASMQFGFNSSAKMILTASGNLGLGVTPSAWGSGFKALQIGGQGSIWANSTGDDMQIGANAFYDGSNYKYIQSDFASRYLQYDSNHVWSIAPSGTAGNAISFTQAMTLNASGNLLVGTTNTYYANNLIVSAGSEGGITIANPSTTGAQYLMFADGTTGSDRFRGYMAYNHTDDSMSFATNAAIKFTIASTGAATFSSSVTAGNLFVSYSGTNAGIEFGNSGGGGQFGFLKWDNASNYLYLGHSYGSAFNRNLVINSSGNVGIGTTSIYGKLHVFSTATSPSLTVGTAAAAIISCAEGQELAITANGTAPYGIAFQGRNNNGGGPSGTSYPIIFNPLGGNVGIATTSPSNLLDIGTPITNALYGFSLSYGGTNVGVYQVNNATGELKFGGAAAGYFPTFYSGGSERMRITSVGNFDYGGYNVQSSNNSVYRQSFYGALSIMWRNAEDSYINSNHTYSSSNTNIASYTSSNGIGRLGIYGGNFEWGSYDGSVSAGSAYTLTSKFIITKAGSVGIGTTSPNGKLTLSYSSSLVDGLIFINTASGGRQWRIGDGSGASAGVFGIYDATAAATRMVIDSNGAVGFSNSIKTGNPGLGSAGAIKLGQRFSGTAIIPSGYIPIDIDGTTYYINLFEQTP